MPLQLLLKQSPPVSQNSQGPFCSVPPSNQLCFPYKHPHTPTLANPVTQHYPAATSSATHVAGRGPKSRFHPRSAVLLVPPQPSPAPLKRAPLQLWSLPCLYHSASFQPPASTSSRPRGGCRFLVSFQRQLYHRYGLNVRPRGRIESQGR